MFYYGDWGLGIGDCPIPNPQSPIPTTILHNKTFKYLIQNYQNYIFLVSK